MRKGASRNMQRISAKVTAGIAPPERGAKQAPFYKQLHAMELHRLARIRYTFELEQEIQQKLSAGDSVGLLRERLNGVRNGTVEPPRYWDARVSGRSTEALRPRTLPKPAKLERGAKRLYASERQLSADLADLAKGKLTLTGVATVKGLLDRFDPDFVAATLGLDPTFIETVQASSVYALAPALSTADGLLLANVLTGRAEDVAGEDAPTPATFGEPPPVDEEKERVSRRYISVDSITAAEYLTLRAHGWSMSGDRVYPPDGWGRALPIKQAAAPAPMVAQQQARIDDTPMPTPAPTRDLVVRKGHKPLDEWAALDVKTTPGKSRRTITFSKRTRDS